MIQSFAFLYIPGRNCDKYRTFMGLYPNVFLCIRSLLLLMSVPLQLATFRSSESATSIDQRNRVVIVWRW